MKIELNLTKDMLKLISMLRIEPTDNYDNVTVLSEYNIGSHLLEDMAIILGLTNKAIPNTKDDANGMAFDDETEKYLIDMHEYIKKNLLYIEMLIHQWILMEQPLTPGKYIAKYSDLIFEKED